MSGHTEDTEDTEDTLRGEADLVTGVTDSPVPQSSQAAGQMTPPVQKQPGPVGDPALASSPAPMTVPSPTVPQAPEAAVPYAATPPEAPRAPYAPAPAGSPEAAGEFAQPQGPPGAPPPPANPWAPAPGTVPDQARTARWRRITVMVLLLVIGLGATGAGGALLYLEETRHATTAEANAAGQQELASLWQRMTIGQIFPRTASYAIDGDQGNATLIGIAPQSSCAAATDPAVAQALTSSGCVTMLRATYVDQSGTVLATIGIAVMKSTSGAQKALSAIQDQSGAEQTTGVLAVGFPGTAFPGSAREVFGSQVNQGPYLFLYTAGYADGRSTSNQLNNGESATTDLGSGLMNAITAAFTAPAKPCASKDISC